jgi:hypothetical protein
MQVNRSVVVFSVVMVALMFGAGSMVDAASKPLNAGKTGFKSNAGGGNGTEDVVAGVSSTSSSRIVSSYYTDVSSGDPSALPTEVVTVELGRQQVGADVPLGGGNTDNFKRTFLVTYQTTTTTGTETVVTTNTFLTTQTFRDTTIVTDMQDVDPGKSQTHNKAPEGQPADISSSSTELVASSGPELVDTSSAVVTETSSAVETASSTEQVTCNPGQGDNPGENFCAGN